MEVSVHVLISLTRCAALAAYAITCIKPCWYQVFACMSATMRIIVREYAFESYARLFCTTQKTMDAITSYLETPDVGQLMVLMQHDPVTILDVNTIDVFLKH